jgi:hypothetical protein
MRVLGVNVQLTELVGVFGSNRRCMANGLLFLALHIWRVVCVLIAHACLICLGLILTTIVNQVIRLVIVVPIGTRIEDFVAIAVDKSFTSFLRGGVIILFTAVLILSQVIILFSLVKSLESI